MEERRYVEATYDGMTVRERQMLRALLRQVHGFHRSPVLGRPRRFFAVVLVRTP
jgi:hypothetical protein